MKNKNIKENCKRTKIAIIGGGIIGVTTGLALQESLNDRLEKVVIISEKWTPNTTGDISAGLIYPFLIGEATPFALLERVFVESMKFYNRLIKDPQSGQFGLSLATMYELFSRKEDAISFEPMVSRAIPLIRDLSEKEINLLFPEEYRYGKLINTYIAEPKIFLPYLMDLFKKQNGHLVTSKVDRISSLNNEYDLIINCTGIGCKYLQDVHDEDLRSARGQVIRVKAPWIRHIIIAGDSYIIPQNECVVLGGTKEKNNYDLLPDANTAQKIWTNCCRLVPSLKYATKIDDFVGLRPYRASLRIERDPQNKQVIHNYGHGGSGVTLCWGSALEVVRLVKEALEHL